MESEFIKTLVSQAPGLAVAAFIVWVFLRNMEKRDQMFIDQTANRDKLFIDQMHKVVERLQSLEQLMIQHDATSKDAWVNRKDTLERIEKKLDASQRKTLKAKV